MAGTGTDTNEETNKKITNKARGIIGIGKVESE